MQNRGGTRRTLLQILEFVKNKTVVLHGSSGQGKSTLAYRYIYERFPEGFAFLIPSITDLGHVLNIKSAVNAFSRPFAHPFLVFIDVALGDVNWVSLCQSLAEINIFRTNLTKIKPKSSISRKKWRILALNGLDFSDPAGSLTFQLDY